MSRNKIKELSDEEIADGFLKCHGNAERLMLGAESLFAGGFIPLANSLLILAVEEEVKAHMIHGVILNRELSNTLNFEPLFSKHEIKKDVAKATVWYWENFGRFIKEVGQDEILKSPEHYILNHEVNSTGTDSENDRKIEGWLNQMPTNREIGLYVDFRNGKWLLPSRIKTQHYKDSLQIFKLLFTVGDHIRRKFQHDVR